jgi:YD repeat-containing protein
MLSRLLVLVICYFIAISRLYSQNAPIKAFVQFPSPEASNLGIVGTMPVSLHTGKLSVEIPISTGDVKNIPAMNLSYNTGGIMPDLHPGWTGLNWTLNAGGVVTRTMNYIPDETETIGFYYTYNVVNSLAYWSYQYAGGSSCWNGICTQADGAADEFYVNAPGLNGRFQIDRLGKFRMLEDPSAQIYVEGIDFYDNNWGYVELAYKPFKGFTVLKNDGTKYRFGYVKELIETTNGISSMPDPATNGYATAWYISQIIYPNGETVNYTYTPKVMDMTPSGNDRNYFSYLDPNLYQDPPPTDGRSDAHGEAGILRTATNHAYLQKIESSLARIDFYTSTSNELKNGQSDMGNWKRLDQIVITDKLQSKVDRTILFNYDPNPKKRLTLLSVVTKNGNNETLPPYEFTYDPGPLPPYQFGQLDFWGYYNNTPYASMIPSVVWPDETNNFYYTPNREPDMHTVGNGILKQIKYPTGGTVSFDFEPNEFSYFRQFTTANEPVSITQVKWGWEQVLNYGENANYYNTYDGRQKFYPLYTGAQPVVLTRYADAAISGSGLNGGTIRRVLAPGTYTHESIQQLLGIPYYIGNGYSIRIRELNPRKKNLGPGLRIKRVIHRSAEDIDMVHEYVYSKNYNQPGFDPELSSGILGNRGAFVLNPQKGVDDFDISTIKFSTSQSPEILTDGSPLGYSEVVDITKDKDGNILGYVINKYTNFDTNPDEMPTADGPSALLVAKKNNKFYERGKLLESATYNNVGKLLTKTVNQYHSQFYTLSKAVASKPDFIYNSGGAYWSNMMIRYTDYFGSSLLESQDQITYSQKTNNYLQTHTTYQYNSNNFPELIKTTTSTGEKKQTIKYSHDYSTPVFADMKLKNMVKVPIETITYVNDKVTDGELNTFQSVVNGSDILILQDNYYKLSLQIPVTSVPAYDGSTVNVDYESPLLQYTSHDAKGNVLETKDRQGIITSYLWGYSSQYPVAKIVGSDINTVKSFVNQNILDNTIGQYTDAQLRAELNNVRTGLAGTTAQVSTYTYDPLHGINSETDPRGKTSYFEYDGFGRLQIIRDQHMNIIKTFKYNYKQ